MQDKEYYTTSNQEYAAKNGILNIKGKISDPQAFGIYSNCDNYYGIYIIRKGNHNYTFNKTNYHDSFSEADNEFKTILKKYESENEIIYKEIANNRKVNNNILSVERKVYYNNLLRKNAEKKDSLLFQYTNKDPFLVLWYIILSIENTTYYSNWYKKIFNILPEDVKNSVAGKRLSYKINMVENLQPDKKFPLEIVNKNFDFKTTNKKYILVDFWFSHCGPCLNDFPKYKEIYSEYKDQGLEIIGISTDRTKDINDWKKVINEKKLPWLHFLDENGIESKKYNINAFPTTFLLNSEGVIMKKNISPEELEIFLKDNIR